MGTGPLTSNTPLGPPHVVGAAYNPTAPVVASGQGVALQTDSHGNLLVNIVSGGTGGNASVSATGTAVPAYATAIGMQDGSGNLQIVSGANPLPITGSISATNPSVGTDGSSGPTSSTQIGSQDGGGNLQAASSAHPIPVTVISGGGSPNVNLVQVGGSSISLGQATMAGSLPVVIANNQSSLPVTVGNFPATTAVTQSTSPWVTSFSAPQHVIIDSATLGTVTVTGTVAISGTVASTQSGTWNVGLNAGTNVIGHVITDSGSTTAVTGTVTVSGTVTSNQGTSPWISNIEASGTALTATGSSLNVNITGGSTAGTQYTNGAVVASGSLIGTQSLGYDGANVRAIATDGSGQQKVLVENFPATQAVTQSTSPWVVSGTVTSNIGTTNGLALDATVSGLQVAQGSTTSGQNGSLIQGAVTTAAPTYTTGKTDPLSLTTAGALRTDSSATTQPVSGTVTANAGTGTFNTQDAADQTIGAAVSTKAIMVGTKDNSGNVQFLTLDASGNLKVTGGGGGTQYTDETAETAGAFTITVAGMYNGTQVRGLRADSSDNLKVNLQTAIPAGTNVIGHVIADSGSTTAVTGNVTVVQPTGTNLHAVVDSGTVTANIGTTNGLALDATVANVQGSATGGTAASKSDLVGGVYNSSAPTLTNGQQASLQLDSSGNLKISGSITASNPSVGTNGSAIPTSSTQIGASDGTNLQQLLVESSSHPNLRVGIYQGANEVTVTSNRLLVDGSGVTQPVSGTDADNAANSTTKVPTLPARANTSAPSWTDGHEVPLSTDLSGNLRVSGNFTNNPADTVGSTVALGALNNAASVAMAGQQGVGFFLAAGTLIGNITPELSYDGGTTWIASQFYDPANQQFASLIAVSGSALEKSIVTSGGVSNARVRVSIYTSGTANCTLRATSDAGNQIPAVVSVAQNGAWSVTANAGTNLNTSALALDTSVNGIIVAQNSTTSGQVGPLMQGAVTTAAPSYTTAKTSPLSLDTNGNLRVNAVTGSVSVTGTVPVTQSGTWTVQPGNTANTTPWLATINQGGNSATVTGSNALKVDGSAVTQPISGTVSASQSGTWTVATNADAAIAAGAAPAKCLVGGSVYNTSAPAPTNGQTMALQADSSGNLKVNVAAGSSGNAAAGATGSAVPASADYLGLNVGGTLRGQTGVNPAGSVYAAQIDIASFNGNQLTGNISAYGTAPSGGNYIGVNAFVTNTVAVSGTITANQGGAPWTIQGDSASGATNAGNPVKAGYVFNTTQPTVTNGQTVDAQGTARGAAIVATGVDTFNVTVNAALPAGSNTIGKVDILGNTGATMDVAQGGATAATNALQVAGVYNSSAPTLTTGQAAALQVNSSGALIVSGATAGTQYADNASSGATPTGTLSMGWDSTNSKVRALKVDASQNLDVNIAASALTDPAEGTTGAAVPAKAIQIGASDGTNLQALVVDAQTNLLVKPGIAKATLSAWNNGTALNATQTLVSGSGVDAVVVLLVQTTTLTAGAATFELTYDDTDWITVPAAQVVDPSSLAQISIPYTYQASTNKAFLVLLQGARQVRIKNSTAITGSGTVTPYVTQVAYPIAKLNSSGAAVVDGSAVTQPVSGTVAATQSGSWSLTANQSVNVAQINGITPLMGNGTTGTGSQRVTIASDNTAFSVNAVQSGTWNARVTGNAGGAFDAATNAAPPANAVQVSSIAATALPSAATATDTVVPMADKFGRQIHILNGMRDIVGAVQVNSSSSSLVSFIAAIASTYNDITTFTATNESSTATIVSLSDGTTTYKYAIAANGGIVVTFPTPLPAASSNTAWQVSNSAAVAVDYTAVYVKNK
jgi:fibronectin-binding autotransporter adhesin